jgi:hypothetical protein
VPGFTARWTIPDGAAELVAAYVEHGLTRSAFEERFTRLARLSYRSACGDLAADLRPVLVQVSR